MTIRPVRFCLSDMARDTLPARKKKKNVQIDGLHIAEITRVRLDALVNEGTMSVSNYILLSDRIY